MPTATLLAPVTEDVSPVLFGVEHEYNAREAPDVQGSSYDGCDCSECADESEESSDFDVTDARFRIPDGWRQHSEHCGWEIKTDATTDLAGVLAAYRDIEEQSPNDRHLDCGLHVHVNCAPALGPAVNPVRFFENYQAHKAEFIYPVTPRQMRTGVRPLTGVEGGRNWAGTVGASSFREWLGRFGYQEINHGALSDHGTIEVRLAAATPNMDHFETYLRTLLGLAAASLYTEDETPLTVVADAGVDPAANSSMDHFLRYKCQVPLAEITALASARFPNERF